MTSGISVTVYFRLRPRNWQLIAVTKQSTTYHRLSHRCHNYPVILDNLFHRSSHRGYHYPVILDGLSGVFTTPSYPAIYFTGRGRPRRPLSRSIVSRSIADMACWSPHRHGDAPAHNRTGARKLRPVWTRPARGDGKGREGVRGTGDGTGREGVRSGRKASRRNFPSQKRLHYSQSRGVRGESAKKLAS